MNVNTPKINHYTQARSVGGAEPLCPLDMHPLGPPLEPEAGSNLSNSKLTYIFRFFTFLINRQCMSQFVQFMIISQILSCTLILFTIFFFSRGFI